MKNKSGKTQYEKMTDTPVPRLILSLSVPAVISMLVTNIYNLVDTAFVGKLGTSASGAVGIVFGFMTVIQAFGFMFGQGAGSILSRSLGDRDPQKASVATWLTRIAHNNAVNLVRSAAYRTRAEMPERDIHGAEDPALLQLEEDNDTVVKLYARLSADEREFLNMRYAMAQKISR